MASLIAHVLLAVNAVISLATVPQSRLSQKTLILAASPNVTFWPFQTFKSSHLHPPMLEVTKSGEELADGYLLFAPGTANDAGHLQPRQTSPMVFTDEGELVWSGENGTFANNFKVSSYKGEPVLSYWSGLELAGTNVGHYYGLFHVLNASYHEIFTFCPQPRLVVPKAVDQACRMDGHESILTEKGSLIITAYNITPADLSPVGGPHSGYAWDCLFYEYELSTGKELFRWRALDHIPIAHTRNPRQPAEGLNATDAFDYFHINSVQPIGDKYYLINARHTWSTYLICAKTGGVVWTIAGDTGGDFGKLSSLAHFRWQHDARVALELDVTAQNETVDPAKDPTRIRWFNNFNAFQGNGTAPSSGLVLDIVPPRDGRPGSTSFVSADLDLSGPVYSVAQGSNQPLPNGHRLLFYGLTPVAKEYGPEGDVRMTVRFGFDNHIQSYRFFRQKWRGEPTTRPSLVVEGRTGYVSWNGATEVTQYVVYEGASESGLRKVSSVPKQGFETSFETTEGASNVLVEAYHGVLAVRNSTVFSVYEPDEL